MGYKTKIDWADATWNPVTGCLHGCEYCYARRIAERFGSIALESNTENGYECDLYEGTGENHVLEKAAMREWKSGKITKAPYPFCFDPTFHRYKLEEPQHWKKPRTIFVCSMADLFGDWVPDEWIAEVFAACEAAPQHRYLFLTKNPARYVDLYTRAILPIGKQYWYGATVTSADTPFFYSRMPDDNPHTFASIEPIMCQLPHAKELPEWIIIGAETGNRKGKVIPERAWVDGVVSQARKRRVPVFMKESLRGLMGDDFRQEFPWKEDV